MAELDIARIKRNVGKMIDQGAPETDIDAYVASEGATPEGLRGGVSAKAEDSKKSSEADLGKQVSALGHGVTSAVAGYGETAKQFLGMRGAGDAANAWAERNAPANYDPAFNKVKEGDLSAIPRAAVEAAPGLGVDIAASTLGGKLGGAFGAKGRLAGAALAGITSYLGRTAGSRAKETATEQGNTGDPTTAQKAQGAATALGEGAVNQLGLKLGVMGGGRVATTGARGVLDAAGALARKGATEGASNVAQDAVSQLGTTAGSDEGARIKDPASLLASGLTGAALGTTLSAPRATRDVAGAIRERGTDTEAATRVSNRIVARVGSPEALSDPKLAFETVSRVKADIGTELGDAAKNAALSPDAQNAINAARSGKALSETDLAHIDSASDPQLSALVRDANEVTRLTDRGQFGNGKFEGGMTAAAKKIVLSHPFLTLGALGGTAGGATLGVPTMLAGAAKAAPALGLLYAAGRGIDHVTGMRSPARSYTEKFADGGATRVPPPAVAAGPTQGAFPGGAPVAPGQGPWGRAPTPVTVPNVAQAAPPALGLAKPPPGFQSLLQTAVMGINKDQKAADRLQKQQTREDALQQTSIAKASAGIDAGIAGLMNTIHRSPPAPLALPAPQPAMPMGAPAPQLALPPPAGGNLPAVLQQAAARSRMAPPPNVINLPQGGAPLPPTPQRMLPPPMQINLPGGEQWPARGGYPPRVINQGGTSQARLGGPAPQLALPAPSGAPAPAPVVEQPAAPVAAKKVKPSAPAIVEALKAAQEPIRSQPEKAPAPTRAQPDDLGIPDFLKRTKSANGDNPLAEAMSKKTLLETAFKDEPVAEDSPYAVQHALPNGKSFGMFAPHKEFADAGKMSAPALADKIIQRSKDAGTLRTTEEQYRKYLVERIQGKRDLAYKLADLTGVDRVKMDQHIQNPKTPSAAQHELQRIKDQWPALSKKIDKILSTAGLEKQDAMTLWTKKSRAKKQ